MDGKEIRADAIVVDRGAYSIEGRSYPWVDLALADGGGVLRATVAQGYEPNGELNPLTRGEALLELFGKEGKAKLRIHGFRAEGHAVAHAA